MLVSSSICLYTSSNRQHGSPSLHTHSDPINDTHVKDQKVLHGLSCDHVKSNIQPKIVVLKNLAFKKVHMCPLQLTKSESSF